MAKEVYTVKIQRGQSYRTIPVLSDEDLTPAVIKELKASRIINHKKFKDHRVVLLSQPRDPSDPTGFSTTEDTVQAVFEDRWQEIFESKVLEYWSKGLTTHGKTREAQLGGSDQFYVFEILKHDQKKRQLLVQWVGYSKEEATWVPIRRLLSFAGDIVKEYLEDHSLTQELKLRKSFKELREHNKALPGKRPAIEKSVPTSGKRQRREDVEQQTMLAKAIQDAANASTSAIQLATAVDLKLERTREEILQALKEDLGKQDQWIVQQGRLQEHRMERLEQDVARLHSMLSERKGLLSWTS